MSDGGKGSKPRPYSVTINEFDNSWERIFGSKNEKREQTKIDKTDQSSESGNLDVSGLHQDIGGGKR